MSQTEYINQSEWRNCIVSQINNNCELFERIFDKFREEMRNINDNLYVMRNSDDVVFLRRKCQFHTIKRGEKPPLGLYYPYLCLFPPTNDQIMAGVSFEIKVKDICIKYHIKHLQKMYHKVSRKTKKINFKEITLVNAVIPILLSKYQNDTKSKKSMYKFIEKIERGILKTSIEKKMSRIHKNKIKEVQTRQIMYQKEQKKIKIVSDIIKVLSVGYYTPRVTRTKKTLKAIFVSYLGNINVVNIDKINQDLADNSLSEISGSSNFTFNQLINYIPDKLFWQFKNEIEL